MTSFWNSISETWFEVFLRATLHGGIAILFVLVICMLFTGQANRKTQCWLWRLVFLKLIILIAFVNPLKIPILPASDVTASVAASVESDHLPASTYFAAGTQDKVASKVYKSDLELDTNAAPNSGLTLKNPVSGQPSHRAEVSRIALSGILFSLWIVGMIFCSAWIVKSWLAARRIRRRYQPITDQSVLACCEALSRNFGISRPPNLATSDDACSPFLIGMHQPTIVFPKGILSKLSDDHVEMVIAHELAHLKRRDLWWTWIPTLAQAIFFFHPLVWLARTRWMLTREMACDELVLSVTKKSAADYADALVNVSSCMRIKSTLPNAEMAFGSTCMVQTSFSLKRRIVAMKNFTDSNPNSLHAVLLFGMAALLAIIPWQPVQRQAIAIAAPVANLPIAVPIADGKNLDFEEGVTNGTPSLWGGGGQGFELTASEDARSGKTAGKITYVGDDENPRFGSLTSGFDATPYHGKRLRYKGYLKSDITDDGTAGLWMRVDGEFDSIGFDNMSSRPVLGKTDWTEYSIVIDIPDEATKITFGFLLSGKGTLLGDDLSFEVVGDIGEGPEVTDMYKNGKDAWRQQAIEKARKKQSVPKNLGLEEGLQRSLPKGWFGGGKGFTVGLDIENSRTGKASARLERIDEHGQFSGLSQRISADPYLGRLIKVTGYIKSEDVTGNGTGLWMRIDGPKRNTMGFDNMNDRPILGTTDWTKYEIEMDVPAESLYITFGFLLKGGGVAWADDFTIETVEVK